MNQLPDQPAAFEVFVDELIERDELLGEYLRLCFLTEENRVKEKSARAAAWQRLRALRSANQLEWFGVTPPDVWRWGVPKLLTLRADEAVLAQVLSSPLGRYVPELRFEGSLSSAMMEQLRGHPALRELEVRSSGGRFQLGALPLRRVRLQGVTLAEGSRLNPELESIFVRSAGLTAEMLRVFAAPSPALRSLEVFGTPEAGQALVTSLNANHRRLTTLGLNVSDTHEALRRVLASGLLDGSLETLTLDGALDAAGFALLEANAERWARVRTLQLGWDFTDAPRLAPLRERIPGLQRLPGRIDASAWLD